MTSNHQIIHGDCLEILNAMPDNSVDLVFCSPPYEAARTYGIGFNLKGQDWVDWCVVRYLECVRVCRGLVAWVVEGQTRKFRYSATPMLLAADLHRAGVSLRKPPAFHRVGIPGSGGPDWLRNDYEFVVCATKGKLPFADNTACGHAPKFPPGGNPSNRLADGRRYNARLQREGDTRRKRTYKPPKKCNPGNLVWCHGGGGHMGSRLAHENEAPFPENLAEFFIKSFCPPDGIVLDCFAGSGTTAAVAAKNGRRSISIEIRQSQVDLINRRISEAGA